MEQLLWNDKFAREETVKKALQKGEVILAQGDTVLGLLADISEKGYTQLDSIKNRSNKPYLLLVANKQKALDLIEKNLFLSFQIEKLMEICWPGPLTFICKAKKDLPWYIRSGQDTIGIRVPQHPELLQLLEYFDGLFSTSANKSGEAIPATIEDVDPDIKERVSYYIKNGNEESEDNQLPSTIIDCTSEKIKIVRQGAFPREKLTDFLK